MEFCMKGCLEIIKTQLKCVHINVHQQIILKNEIKYNFFFIYKQFNNVHRHPKCKKDIYQTNEK